MFGCIVTGRLVQTNLQQVEPNKFLFLIEDAASVNHIVLFLLGTTPLPEGAGAGIYLGFNQQYIFLGFISNEKPSAVFRLGSLISTLKDQLTASNQAEMAPKMTLQIGISIETLSALQQMQAQKDFSNVSSTVASTSTTVTTGEMVKFAQKMLQHLFNFATSFAKPATEYGFGSSFGQALPELIPTEVFKKWYSLFEHKITTNPEFWRNL